MRNVLLKSKMDECVARSSDSSCGGGGSSDRHDRVSIARSSDADIANSDVAISDRGHDGHMSVAASADEADELSELKDRIQYLEADKSAVELRAQEAEENEEKRRTEVRCSSFPTNVSKVQEVTTSAIDQKQKMWENR